MKKLLSLLGTISIASSSLTIVGFSYANLVKSSIEAKVRNYLNISSLLARATILSQKSSVSTTDPNNPVKTDGQDFSLRYASKYLYGKQMKTFFDKSQFANGDASVLSYFGSMFNLPSSSSFVYTVKENPNFETASPSIYLQEDVNTGKSGEDATINTLTMIAAFAPILLGTDFNAVTSGSFLENVAGAGEAPILSLMQAGTFKTIQDILFDSADNNKSLFTKISESLNEEAEIILKDQDGNNVGTVAIEDATYDQVFKFRQIKFWQGISEILFSGTRANDTPEQIKQWMDDIANAKPSKYAETAIPEDASMAINVQANKLLFDGIIRILPYLRTLFNYIQSFSENALKIDEIQDYNHLFDPEKINGMFMADHLRTKYLNSEHIVDQTTSPEIIQWVKNSDGSYHQVLNVQDLVQFFQELLTVDLINDPNGYRNIRVLSILLELPLKSTGEGPDSKDSDVANPVFDTILEPLLVQILKKTLTGAAKLIIGFIPQLTPAIRGVLTHSQSFWVDTDGAPTTYSSVLKIVNFLGGIGNLILPGLGDALKELATEIKNEQDNPLPPDEQFYGNPFKNLFNGELLPKIFEILTKHNITIPPALVKMLKNLATLLTTNLEEVLAAFGLNITTLPIFLYGIKGKTLTEIIDSFAKEFDVNVNKTLKENQAFLFNLGALDRVMTALDQKTDLQFNLGSGIVVPDPVKEVLGDADADGWIRNVNVVNGILVAFAYSDLLKDLTINGENWNTTDNRRISRYTFLMGTRVEGSAFKFASGSLFASISQIYGHDNPDEPEIMQTKNPDTLRRLISGFSKLVNWFSTFSIPLYIQEIFDPYFDSKNWHTTLLKARNLDDLKNTATIQYFLYYKNPDTQQTHKYEVIISRDPATGSDSEWTEMGTWKINSINLKK